MRTRTGPSAELGTREASAYTDGASTGSRGPGGYGAVLTWGGRTEEVSGGERDTTNLRMELMAACAALETIDGGRTVTVYSDASYLVNCMRRGWHERWRENGWLNHRGGPVANRDLWERLLGATRRHREVRWRKVKGHRKTAGAHKAGNDRADELAVAAKKEAIADLVGCDPGTVSDGATHEEPKRPPEGTRLVPVGGEKTFEEGAHPGARNGAVPRRSGG